MKILIDARPLVDPKGGGVTRVASGLLSALVGAMPTKKFLFVTTGLHNPSSPPLNLRGGWEELHQHKTIPNKLFSLLCFLGLTSFERLVTKEKPDLLFLPNLGFVGKLKIPYVLLVHDLSFLVEPRWFSLKNRLWHYFVGAKNLIKNAKHLFAVSERTKQDLIHLLNIPAERITVIPMGLTAPTHTFDDLPPQLVGRRYVLALGANNPRKNTGCAIAAVDALRQDPKFKDVTLVLIGNAKSQISNLKSQTIQKSKIPNLRFDACDLVLSYPQDAAIATLMKNASAFLYPSWYEGFGLPLHEAARFGTPCIASTAGALPETAPAGTLFAPPSKPHLWTRTLEMVLEQPEAHRTSTLLGDWTAAAETIKTRISI